MGTPPDPAGTIATVVLPRELHARTKARAEAEGVDFAEVLRSALRHYLETTEVVAGVARPRWDDAGRPSLAIGGPGD
jgi:hypothetical protein